MNRQQARDNLARVIRKTIDYLADQRVDLPLELLAWRRQADTFRDPGQPPADPFSIRGAGKPGAKTKEAQAVNAYAAGLQRQYQAWADDLADELADAPEDERDDILDEALAALLILLRQSGRAALPEAVALGLGDHTPDGDIMQLLSDAMDENDDYLEDALIPDLRQKLRNAFLDGDILAALAAGAGAAALGGVLAGMLGRVGYYAGAWWDLYNQVVGETARDNDYGVRWNLDERAKHCNDCLEFGDREYNNYDDMLSETGGMSPAHGVQCSENCRCWLEWITD